MSLFDVILPSWDARAALADAGSQVKSATAAVLAARRALEAAEEDLEAAEAQRERAGRERLRERAQELREEAARVKAEADATPVDEVRQVTRKVVRLGFSPYFEPGLVAVRPPLIHRVKELRAKADQLDRVADRGPREAVHRRCGD